MLAVPDIVAEYDDKGVLSLATCEDIGEDSAVVATSVLGNGYANGGNDVTAVLSVADVASGWTVLVTTVLEVIVT